MCANKGKTKRQNGPMRGFSIRRKGCCVYVTKNVALILKIFWDTTNRTLSSSISWSLPSQPSSSSSSSSSSSMSTSSGKGIFWPKSLIAGSLFSCIFWGSNPNVGDGSELVTWFGVCLCCEVSVERGRIGFWSD